MSFGARIAAARAAMEMTQSALAKTVGVSRAAVAQWEGETTVPTLDKVEVIARALGKSPCFLAFGEGAEDAEVLDGAPVDQFEIRVSAGHGALIAEEMRTGRWVVPPQVLSRMRRRATDHLAIIEARGDSMAPTIADGEPIWVSTHPDDLSPYGGGIFVISDGVGTMVKRLDYILRSDPPRVRVVSDNPAYSAVELTADELTIHARVVAKLAYL